MNWILIVIIVIVIIFFYIKYSKLESESKNIKTSVNYLKQELSINKGNLKVAEKEAASSDSYYTTLIANDTNVLNHKNRDINTITNKYNDMVAQATKAQAYNTSAINAINAKSNQDNIILAPLRSNKDSIIKQYDDLYEDSLRKLYSCYNCDANVLACPNGVDYEIYNESNVLASANTPVYLSRMKEYGFDNISFASNLMPLSVAPLSLNYCDMRYYTMCDKCTPGSCYYSENINSRAFTFGGQTYAVGTTAVTLRDFSTSAQDTVYSPGYWVHAIGSCQYPKK